MNIIVLKNKNGQLVWSITAIYHQTKKEKNNFAI